ncbi:hypothetical protein DINM_002959 [Dirofilaria immitis]|nr:hypothetical protein [Dirofilaria immitis]
MCKYAPDITIYRAEVERICWDPKDGELYLSRMKPEEILVEVRSNSDVQIDRLTLETIFGSKMENFLNDRIAKKEYSQKTGSGKVVRQPGVEPGSAPWEGAMIPLHHWRPSVQNIMLVVSLFA